MNTKELVEALNTFPELKARVEELVSVASNPSGQIELADDAEERILAISPQLNEATLQAWAESQSQKQSDQFSRRHKGARKDVKKN